MKHIATIFLTTFILFFTGCGKEEKSTSNLKYTPSVQDFVSMPTSNPIVVGAPGSGLQGWKQSSKKDLANPSQSKYFNVWEPILNEADSLRLINLTSKTMRFNIRNQVRLKNSSPLHAYGYETINGINKPIKIQVGMGNTEKDATIGAIFGNKVWVVYSNGNSGFIDVDQLTLQKPQITYKENTKYSGDYHSDFSQLPYNDGLIPENSHLTNTPYS